MKRKRKTDKILFSLIAFGILLFSICLAGTGISVRADGSAFDTEARMLPSGNDTYDIQITVENHGADWEGTARLILNRTAYDTVLSLPQGSTKQFVVRVPKDSLEYIDTMVKVTLLDKKSDKSAEKEFKRLLQNEADSLSMGILSDAYSSLTYLDMGGEEISFSGDNYPIKLVELNQDNLADSLETLAFLAIDTYDTGVLTDEAVKSIELWVDNGGILIIGTGSYAEDTLRGLDFLKIQCKKIYAPEEYPHNTVPNVDMSQLSMAELTDISNQYDDYYSTLALVCESGNGAVGILPYALSELGALDASAYQDAEYRQEFFVRDILDEISSNSYVRYAYTSNANDTKYTLHRIGRILGNGNTRLNFGVLKLIVILYVIFAGPILYLILRFMKKQDFYWAAVPAAALVGILLVYLSGRGFEVSSARVYSVTVQNLSDGGNSKTYLHCYDASHKEWNLRLAEGFDYAGPWANYNYSYDDKYYHHIKKEGDRLFIGIKPTTSFEDSYFLASGAKETVSGSISNDIKISGDISGTVTNGTDRNFKYFAVIVNDTLHVYKNLPAGETGNLATAECVFNSSANTYYGNIMSNYLYDYMGDVYRQNKKADADILAALGVGIGTVYSEENPDAVIVIGVTENWSRTVDDNCSEVSYGCLYTIQ